MHYEEHYSKGLPGLFIIAFFPLHLKKKKVTNEGVCKVVQLNAIIIININISVTNLYSGTS